MSTVTIPTVTGQAAGEAIGARPAGLVRDLTAIAGRALRAVPRDVEAVVPPVFIALFFFIVNIATGTSALHPA
jgi:ABC-2 type transport system permease protein